MCIRVSLMRMVLTSTIPLMRFPYFMAGMRGNVNLGPNTTAPEDQIIPQALSSPLRGGDYGPLNGAVITSFTSTGTNAYSLQRQEVVRLIAGMKAEGRCEGVGTVIIPAVQAWPVACTCIAAAAGTRVRFSNLRWGAQPSLTSLYMKFFFRLSRPHTSFTDIHCLSWFMRPCIVFNICHVTTIRFKGYMRGNPLLL